MTTIKTLTSDENGAQSMTEINANFISLNSGKLEAWTPVTTAVNLVLAAVNSVILVDSTGGAKTITLPSAVGNSLNYYIKDWKGQASAKNITINTSLSQTIDGALTKLINTNYGSFNIVSDGSNWTII